MPDASFVSDLTVTQSFTATGSVAIVTQGFQSVGIQLTGTWVATIFFEGSQDGTVWYSLNAIAPDTGTGVTSATINGNWIAQCGGSAQIRARVGAYTSGTVVVQLLGTAGSPVQNTVVSTLPPMTSRTGGSSSLTANGQSNGVITNGCGSAVFQVSGTWVGTLQFQGTGQDGTTFAPVYAVRLDILAVQNNPASRDVVFTTTTNGTFLVDCGGMSQVICKFTAFTSGTATVTALAGSGSGVTYVHPINRGRNVSAVVSANSFRTLGSAATPQNLFTLHNQSGSPVILAVRDLSVVFDSIVVELHWYHFRISRITTLPTGGTVLSKVLMNTNFTSNANVVALGATNVDGGSASAITATAGTSLWQTFLGHPNTVAAWGAPLAQSLLPPGVGALDPLILNASEFLVVQVITVASPDNANTNNYLINAAWEEFTYP